MKNRIHAQSFISLSIHIAYHSHHTENSQKKRNHCLKSASEQLQNKNPTLNNCNEYMSNIALEIKIMSNSSSKY